MTPASKSVLHSGSAPGPSSPPLLSARDNHHMLPGRGTVRLCTAVGNGLLDNSNYHPSGDGGATGHHIKKRPRRGSAHPLQQTPAQHSSPPSSSSPPLQSATPPSRPATSWAPQWASRPSSPPRLCRSVNLRRKLTLAFGSQSPPHSLPPAPRRQL